MTLIERYAARADALQFVLHRGIDAHAEKVRRELRAMTIRNRRAIGQYTRIRRRK